MLHLRIAAAPLAATMAAMVATRCPSTIVRSSAVPSGTTPSATSAAAPAAVAGARLALRRFGGAAPFTYYSGVDDSSFVVVRDAATWRAQWRAINREMQPLPPAPAVDFAREMIVVAALGHRASGGWGIAVDSAVWRGGAIDVFVRQLAPGRGCFTTAAISSPVDVVRLPRRDAPVRFDERVVREDCD